MSEFLRAYFQRLGNEDESNSPIRFVASTEGVKSDGQDLKKEDWSLDRYLKHPVILYAHDFVGRNLPIGTGTPSFEGRDLMIDVTFDPDDEFAMKVRAKTVKGMMGGSVSWDVIKQGTKRVNELLEFSVVPIPLDPNSLPVRQARAMFDMATQFQDAMEADTRQIKESDLLDGLKLAMRAVYVVQGLDESKRRKVFNGLERLYNMLDLTAPEWKDVSELTALDEITLRGLFLEGEYAVRAGAVLNARNKEKLVSARDAIDEVLKTAEKAVESETDTERSENPPNSQFDTELRAILTRAQLLAIQ